MTKFDLLKKVSKTIDKFDGSPLDKQIDLAYLCGVETGMTLNPTKKRYIIEKVNNLEKELEKNARRTVNQST